jgi:hypothetical protein
MDDDVEWLGKVAYEAYRMTFDAREKPPPWDQQDPKIREAWRVAADTVRMCVEVRR